MANELAIIIKARNEAKRALDSVKKDLNQIEKETKSANSSFSKFQNILGKGVRTAAIGATAAIAGIGLSLGGVIANSTMAAADMEEQVSGIAAVMGASGDEIERINDLILDLGVNPNLKVSATEAADAIELLARNGVSLTEIENEMAEATVLLANATSADFATAADVATDTMAAFKDSIESGMSAVNGITAVTVNSKFSIDDYRLALANAGASVASMGVEFDDFNTYLAATASFFDSGAQSGTAFRNFIVRLTPSTVTATEAMKELGLMGINNKLAMQELVKRGVDPANMSMAEMHVALGDLIAQEQGLERNTEEAAKAFTKWGHETGILQSAFYDANGNLKDMAEISGILQNALGDLSEAQKSAALETIFGQDAMNAAVGMMEIGEKQFRNLQKVLADTDALESAKTRMDNLKGSIEIFQGIVETVSLRIGNAFIPIVRKAVEGLSTFLADNSEQIISFFEGVATGVESVVSSIETFITNAQPKIEQIKGLFTGETSFKDLFPDMENNSFIKAITDLVDEHLPDLKIAFSVAKLQASGLKDEFDNLSTETMRLVNNISVGIGTLLVGAFNFLLIAVKNLLPVVVPIFGVILTVVTSTIATINAVLEGFGKVITGLLTGDLETATEGAKEIWNAFKQHLLVSSRGLRTSLRLIWTGVKNTIIESVEEFTGVDVSPFFDGIETAFSNGIEKIKEFATDAKTHMESVTESIKPVVGAIGSLALIYLPILKAQFDSLVESLDPTNISLETIKQTLEDSKTILDDFKSKWEEIKKTFEKLEPIITPISDAFDTFVNVHMVNFKKALDEMKEDFGPFVESLKELWGSIKLLGEQLSRLATPLMIIGGLLLNSLGGAIEGAIFGISMITTVLSGLAWVLLKVLTPAVRGWANSIEIVSNIIKGLGDAIAYTFSEQFINDIKTKLEELGTGFTTMKENVVSAFQQMFSSVVLSVAGIGTSIAFVFNGAKTIITTVSDSIKTKWEDTWNGISNFTTTLFETLGGYFTRLNDGIESIKTKAIEIKNTWVAQWGKIKETTTSVISSIKSFIDGFMEKIDEVAGAAMSMWTGVKNAFQGMKDDVLAAISPIKGAVQSLIDLYNRAIQLAKDLIFWGSQASNADTGTSNNTTDTPPANATGTSLFGGGLTLVGERGPELVSLPKGSKIFNDQETQQMIGASSVTVNVNATVRNDNDVEMLVQRIKRELQRNQRMATI